MEQAEAQLESTLTAMGTVYSQGHAPQRPGCGIGPGTNAYNRMSNDQVQALQDVVTTRR